MATLPSSNLTLTAICSLFNAPLNTRLSSFIKGGAYVSTIYNVPSIPTAPPISISNFFGVSAFVASISFTVVPVTQYLSGTTFGLQSNHSVYNNLVRFKYIINN